MNAETLLYVAIEDGFNELNDIKDVEQRKARVDELTKLMDRAIEMEKNDNEQALKKQQMVEEKRDRLVKNIIAGVGIVLPVVVTVWGTLATFAFEKDDSITTIMGRGFVNKLLPKK